MALAGTLLVVFSASHLWHMSETLFMVSVLSAWGISMAVVLGAAHLLEKRRTARLVAAADSTQIQEHQLYREQMGDLPAGFVDLRERLCRGIGGKDTEEWRAKLNSAVFPGSDLGDVTDRWLRTLFTIPDGPLQRALWVARGGPKSKRLQSADIGVPLPGERRPAHMTPAWYAGQIARASKKAATPRWRSYVDFMITPVMVGGFIYLHLVAHAPLTVLGAFTILVILVSPALYAWSEGVNPGESYAWHTMSRYLVAEMHAAAPHALQPDCLDTDCPHNPDDSAT